MEQPNVDIDLNAEAEDFARAAGLIYVRDETPGIRRKPWGRGFTYVDEATGETIRDATIRGRIESLVIPPAWTDVWICSDPRGHIQATGRDDAGRKQYIYHPDWEAARNAAKFSRLVYFAEALPLIRERYESGLRKRSLGREKVLSVVLRLLDETLIRVGNSMYAKANNSFGLTTLRDRHVAFSEEGCVFLFTGKSGKEQRVLLDDPRLSRVVRECRDVPGYDLFQYYDEDGRRCTISSGDVNAFLQEVTGESFTAKTFRTWGASVHAATTLYAIGPGDSERQVDRNVVAMVKDVAERLGNTPAICRDYYIHPAIPETYRNGILLESWSRYARRKRLQLLDANENVVRHLLREHG